MNLIPLKPPTENAHDDSMGVLFHAVIEYAQKAIERLLSFQCCR